MKWPFRIALAVMLLVGMCGSTAAQRAEPTRIGFISYAPSVDKLLPEEQAAFEFCNKQLKLPATLITLEQIARGKGKLSEYNLIWWHYARGWPDDHDGHFALSGLPAGAWALSFAAGITISFKDGRTGARLTITKHAAASQ